MELRQIKHLVAVAETGSFTKAAERVSISQPALSASIAKLEAELEVQLLERNRSKITPTPAGRSFLERAGSILLACSAMKAETKNIAYPQPLRIGILRTLPTHAISDLIRAYRIVKPGSTVNLYEGSHCELQTRVKERKLHALISTSDPTLENAQSHHLFTDRFVVAVPLDHRFARWDGLRLSDFNGEPFISRAGCETYANTTREFLSRRIKPQVMYTTNQDDRALAMVAAGIGLALIPQTFDHPGIAMVKLLDYEISRTIGIQWDTDFTHENLENFVRLASSQQWVPNAHEIPVHASPRRSLERIET